MRKDLRDLFDQLAMARYGKQSLCPEKSHSSPELFRMRGLLKGGSVSNHYCKIILIFVIRITNINIIGLLTRNGSLDLNSNVDKSEQKKVFDHIAATSILENCVGLSRRGEEQVVTMATLRKFCETRQMEHKTDEDLKMIVQVNKRPLSLHILKIEN